MASTSPNLPRRAWKPDTEAAVHHRRIGPAWRHDGSFVGRSSFVRRRSLAISGLGLLFLVSLGLLIWLVSWLWPLHPSCLVLVGAGYEENLLVPANVQGWQGMQDLAELCRSPAPTRWWGPGWPRLAHAPKELRVGDAWDAGLEQVREKTVVVYLALHGGADAQGAYLLPSDADARPSAENRLRLEAILSRLAQLPEKQYKVLVLDAVRIDANWPLGMLQNDFARALDQLNDRIAAVPNLVVMSSGAADQRSWGSNDWRQTAFAHFFARGLAGAAAQETQAARINLWSLHQYVHNNVESWVWSNRQSLQTPVLLPQGAEGERRARQIDLALVGRLPPEAPVPPAFQPPPELLQAWQHHHELAAQLPAPAFHSPGLWRVYCDVLLRYETLLIAGGSTQSIARLAGWLSELELAMRQAQHLDLRSLSNALTMPAAAGYPPALPSVQARRRFTALWTAAPAEQGKQWAALLAAAGNEPRAREVLRLQFYELLLERATEAPLADRAPAEALLRVLADPVNPRPSELQYLAMLYRDLPQPPPGADLLRRALLTRTQAERTALDAEPGAYPYCGEVFRWIQARVDDGDNLRRQGQDLLFAGESASWEKGRGLLEQSQEVYRRAQADGATLRTALALRDRALSLLPYYSYWLARRRLSDERELQARDEAQVRAVEQLWQDTYQLTDLLDEPRAAALAEGPGRLPAQTAVVRRGFDELTHSFTQSALALSDVNLQGAWRDITDVLVVPDIEPALRMELLVNRARISRQLLLETTANAEQVALAGRARFRDRRKEEARRQGRLALAELGARWFDQCRAADAENFVQARHRLDTFMVEANWWQSLAVVGTAIGHCWRQQPETINRLIQEGRSADVAPALAAFAAADRLARVCDGADLLSVHGQPAQDYRRLLAHQFLLWLSRRTWADHWFAEDPRAEPYYRVAGLLYVSDARSLDPRLRPNDDDVKAAQHLLTEPGEIVVQGLTRRAFTSEQSLELDYQLHAAIKDGVPPGYPVVWLRPGDGVTLATPPADQRLVRQIGAAAAEAAVSCRLLSPLLQKAEADPPRVPRMDPSALTLRGLYRGQRLEQATRVELYPLPEVIVRHDPLPQTGSVAVRGGDILTRYGASNGAIAIVLDCSGSMGPATGQAFGPTTKYAEALAALRQVLRRLPRGATVSVWTFGQAMGAQKTVVEAERTVQRVQEPIRWDPDDPGQLRNLMARVEDPALEPWNESPIVYAMVRASAGLRRAAGFKTLLVLTDGMDNRFANDRALNPDRLDIPTFLTQTFRDSGIVINMIGYKVVDQEEKQAEAQFKVIEKLPLPGKFVTVKQSQELAGILERALRQTLHYWVDQDDNVPLPGQGSGQDVTWFGANLQWFPRGLAPRIYRLRVHTDRRLLKYIDIKRGDLLLVDLHERDGRTVFERGLYSRSEFPGKPAAEQSGWRLAVLQNQSLNPAALQMLLTLEKLPDVKESTLEMLKPRRTWIEVQPDDSLTPYCQRWGARSGYPAPAWGLDVPAWPGGPARPRLRVWWNPDQETLPAATLERGADFRTLADLRRRDVPLDGVRIESVAIESHPIRTGDAITMQSCLVVRINHPQGRAVWAELRGLAPAAHEHRFYTQAGEYTGLFWPVMPDDVATLTGIRLYSLPAFKSEAEKRGFTIEMRGLSAPEASDVRPRVPIKLK